MNDIFVAAKHPPAHSASSGSKTDGEKMQGHVGILSNFCKNPQGIHFQTQKPDESIILFLRAHLVTNLFWVLGTIFLIFLPIIITIILPMLNINIFSPNIARFAIVYILFYYLIVFSYAFVNFLHWFYVVFMVTTQQVVDVDYSDIVVHHVAVTSLNQVQDAKYTQSGFIPTLLNYGNIFVQTAGTQPNFEESSVPKPREATHIIGDVIGKHQKKDSK